MRGEPVKRPLADFQVGSQLVECEDRLLARCHTTPTSSVVTRPRSRKFLQDFAKGITPNMPKVKSQHPATCWPIDVTQIFKGDGRDGPIRRRRQRADRDLAGAAHGRRSNANPHTVAERPKPLARPHVPWRKLVWARPADDFPETAQANVRNGPVVAADRVTQEAQWQRRTILAKSSNPRPQGPCVTIWVGKRTRVRFRVPPPEIPENANLHKLAFFSSVFLINEYS